MGRPQPPPPLLEALLVSIAVVALGELGDKTQLLALVLAARYPRPWPIVAGIFVRTTTPEAPGTQLNLRFSSETAGPIEVEGEVIWVNPYRPGTPDNLHPGMGIRFLSLDNELRDRLLELIRRFAYLS